MNHHPTSALLASLALLAAPAVRGATVPPAMDAWQPAEHQDVELQGPTRGGLPEAAAGPLRVQGDHGAVAFRSVRVKPIAPVAAAGGGYAWEQTPVSLALLKGGKTIWRLMFDPKASKSAFHPLASVDGEVLTAFRPQDHPWHRGLWFSWKFINGLNYWEEDPNTGIAEGLCEITSTKVTTHPDFSAAIRIGVSYHPPGKPALLTEVRTLKVAAPDANGCYVIDWTSVFTTGAEAVELNRTPPKASGGVDWGGYAGLSLRFPTGIEGWSFSTSEGAADAAAGNAKNARWADFSSATAGVAIFDHPQNLRYPTPWYLNQSLPFFSPAVLFNEPLNLVPGQAFTLRYRVLVHRGAAHGDVAAHTWERP